MLAKSLHTIAENLPGAGRSKGHGETTATRQCAPE